MAEAWSLEPLEATTQLPPGREAPSVARWFLWSTAAGDILPAEMETATLLVSEVVSNAQRHGSPDTVIRLWCRIDGERVFVSVRNRGPRFDPQPGNTRGYGLRLLDALSDRWGARPTEDGMEVWFEV